LAAIARGAVPFRIVSRAVIVEATNRAHSVFGKQFQFRRLDRLDRARDAYLTATGAPDARLRRNVFATTLAAATVAAVAEASDLPV
jgi:hypothetical protein